MKNATVLGLPLLAFWYVFRETQNGQNQLKNLLLQFVEVLCGHFSYIDQFINKARHFFCTASRLSLLVRHYNYSSSCLFQAAWPMKEHTYVAHKLLSGRTRPHATTMRTLFTIQGRDWTESIVSQLSASGRMCYEQPQWQVYCTIACCLLYTSPSPRD